jgi:hypothetical protein
MTRMMIYSWNDQDNALDETKMGDHFVPLDCTLQEAEQQMAEITARHIQNFTIDQSKSPEIIGAFAFIEL